MEEKKKEGQGISPVRPGQDIVMIGSIGLGGTVQAAEEKKELLLKTLPRDLLETARGFGKVSSGKGRYLAQEELEEKLKGTPFLKEVERGGIFAALWELSEDYKVGFTVWLRKIPVCQETVEICEVLDLNPYGLLSGSCFLAAADNGNDLLTVLEREGIPAVFIGKITDSKDKMILNGENCRYLNRPEPDEVERLSQIPIQECGFYQTEER